MGKNMITKGEKKWIIYQILSVVAGILLVVGINSFIDIYIGFDLLANPFLTIFLGVAIFVIIAYVWEKKYLPFK